MRVYLSKNRTTSLCEFLEYNIVTDEINFQSNMGEINMKDGMETSVLVAKLRDAANRIERSKTDIYVIQ